MRVSTPMLSKPWPSGEPTIAWHGQIQPVPNHRPKVYQRGNNQRFARAVKPEQDTAFEVELQIAWYQARLPGPLEGPIALVCEFSGNTTNRAGRRAPRPDLSNLIKALEDAGNGVLWVDDRQVMQIAGAIRRWDRSATPIVALWVWELTAWPELGDPADGAVMRATATDDVRRPAGRVPRDVERWPLRNGA